VRPEFVRAAGGVWEQVNSILGTGFVMQWHFGVRAALLTVAYWLVIGQALRSQQVASNPALLEVRQKLPPSLAPSQAAALEIQVTNHGGAAAENVIVTSSVTSGWDLLDADPIADWGARRACWRLGTIEPNGSRLVRLRLTPAVSERAPAELRSDVQATYQANAATGGVVAVQRPSLDLSVTGQDATPPGEPTSLLITVANNGNAPAENVTLQTLLPPGLSHPSGNDLETAVGTLRPGETRLVTLMVTPTRAGEFQTRIRASIAGEPAAERDATVSAPAFKLAAEAHGPRNLYLGWTGSFEISIRNDDSRPAQQVAIVVALPAGLAVSRAGDNASYDAKAHLLRWQPSNLGPGEARTLVWSGVARSVGEQICQVQITAASQGRKTLEWRTAVADAPVERPAASGHSTLQATVPVTASSRATPDDPNWRPPRATLAGTIVPVVSPQAAENAAAPQAAADRR